jgi:hypothetical protein
MISSFLTQSLSQASQVGFGFQSTKNVAGTREQTISATVPAATTNALVHGTLALSGLLLLIIESDAMITIKTNSNTSPADTLLINAGQPLIWDGSGYFPSPLTADVTALYITTTTDPANLTIYAVS